MVRRWSIGGLDLTHTWYVLNTQTDSYQALNAAVNVGVFRLNSLTRFNLDPSCHYVFSSSMSSLYWSWCDVPMSAQLSITDAGFNYAQLRADSIPIERWAWLPDGLYVNTALRFDLTSGKVFTASFGWRPTQIGCVEVFAELDLDGPGAGPVTGDTIIDGISVYGMRISCSIPGPYGDVRVVSATSFTDSKNSTITGQSDYFEVIRLSGPMGSCCGYPGMWSVATYFNEDETSVLFDWGMTVISADINISDHFTGYIETVFRSEYFDDPRMEITVGWTARW